MAIHILSGGSNPVPHGILFPLINQQAKKKVEPDDKSLRQIMNSLQDPDYDSKHKPAVTTITRLPESHVKPNADKNGLVEFEYFSDQTGNVTFSRKIEKGQHKGAPRGVNGDRLTNAAIFLSRGEVSLSERDIRFCTELFHASETIQAVTGFLTNSVVASGVYMQGHEDLVRMMYELETQLSDDDQQVDGAKQKTKRKRKRNSKNKNKNMNWTFQEYLGQFNRRVNQEWRSFIVDAMRSAICYGFVPVTIQDSPTMGAIPTVIRMETVDVKMRTDCTCSRVVMTYTPKYGSGDIPNIDAAEAKREGTLPAFSELSDLESRGVFTFFFNGQRPRPDGRLCSYMTTLRNDRVTETIQRYLTLEAQVARVKPRIFITHKSNENTALFKSSEQLAATLTETQSRYPNGVAPIPSSTFSGGNAAATIQRMQNDTMDALVNRMRNITGGDDDLMKSKLNANSGNGGISARAMLQNQQAVSEIQRTIQDGSGAIFASTSLLNGLALDLVSDAKEYVPFEDAKIEKAPESQEPGEGLIEWLDFFEGHVGALMGVPGLLWKNTRSKLRSAATAQSGPDDPANVLFRSTKSMWFQFCDEMTKTMMFIIFTTQVEQYASLSNKTTAQEVPAMKEFTGIDVLASAASDTTNAAIVQVAQPSHALAVDRVSSESAMRASDNNDSNDEEKPERKESLLSSINNIELRLTSMTDMDELKMMYNMGEIKHEAFVKVHVSDLFHL